MLGILRAAGQTFDLAGLERVTAQLLRQGFADGFLSIQARKTWKYLELTKYIRAKGDYGLRLHVPIEPWSEPYLGMVQAYCSREKIEFSVENEDPDLEILSLRIDCQKDVSRAYELVRTIFTRIYRVPETSKFSVVLRNCSVWHELVDDPAQEEMSWAEGKRRMNADAQRRLGVSLRDLSLSMLLGMAQMLGVAGLAYSVALAKHSWIWSDFAVGDISIRAPILGLFFGVVVLISFLRVATRSFWIRFHNNKKIRNASMMITQFHKVAYVLCNYVNIVSIVLLSIAASAWTNVNF